MQAGLYIIPTPIGNIEDITIRAINILKASDFILCEDTRVTKSLLEKYDINNAKLSVYNDHSNHNHRLRLLDEIKKNKVLSLVSDAGTPLIADPGYKLINYIRSQGFFVDVLPGPCSIISALCLSGMPSDRFIFLGFMQKKLNQQINLLKKFSNIQATLIFFESPKRLSKTLQAIHSTLGQRNCAIAREMTKIHQEIIQGSSDELIELLDNKDIKGEVVLLVEKQEHSIDAKQIVNNIALLMENGMSQSQATHVLSVMLKLPKNKLYSLTKSI